MSVLRTPDACFDNLPLWNYEPQYFTSTLYGLEVRIAYYDLGEQGAEETILLTHGMSTWSYLYRRMIPPLVSAGHRVILFDQVGCGRSDKPSREEATRTSGTSAGTSICSSTTCTSKASPWCCRTGAV